MKNKKGFEMSFSWLFAIIVGAVIIFLAIYAAVKLVGTERTIKDTESGKQLSTLLNPIETTLETGKETLITFPQDTRVYNACSPDGNFGTQSISVATSSNLGKQWGSPGVPIRFYNKYLFSDSVLEGQNLYVFDKPFSMPYKIADIVFAWTDKQKYCFINPQNDIIDDVSTVGLENIQINDSASCPAGSIKVCFERSCSSSSDVFVDRASLSVIKRGQKTVYYADTSNNALLYAALFADSTSYECQLQRLMKRSAELASLYSSKSDFLSSKGCSSTVLGAELLQYSNSVRAFNSSIQINTIDSISRNMKEENDALSCSLF